MFDVFKSKQCINYIRSCKEVAPYFKENMCPSVEIEERYHGNLDKYRLYLDRLGIRMPKPRFPYDKKDTRTWKYLENKVFSKNPYFTTVENKDYIYKGMKNGK